ncbi:hypothetical protein PMIT1303_01543 [Prochlorococcus sp. MIT 1303]|nr:hypothetical protein PMIT1303_01543 [Prochlorococcus sp. MIT 1303]
MNILVTRQGPPSALKGKNHQLSPPSEGFSRDKSLTIQVQIKLFSAIASAADIGASFITTTPADAGILVDMNKVLNIRAMMALRG